MVSEAGYQRGDVADVHEARLHMPRISGWACPGGVCCRYAGCKHLLYGSLMRRLGSLHQRGARGSGWAVPRGGAAVAGCAMRLPVCSKLLTALRSCRYR